MHEGIDDLADQPILTEGEEQDRLAGSLDRTSMALAATAHQRAVESGTLPVPGLTQHRQQVIEDMRSIIPPSFEDFNPKPGIMERYAKTEVDESLYKRVPVAEATKDTHGDDNGEEWIGIDLDGTLAEYTTWKGADHIGKPIKPMIDRVKAWIKEGQPIKILTARVAPGKPDTAECRKHVEAWAKEQFGQDIEVTHEKDHLMRELWDDRAVQVEPNSGLHILVALARELGVSLDYNEDIKAFAKHLKAALKNG